MINSILRNQKLQYIALIVIFLLSLALRLYKIDSPIADWHSWRQADTASVARIFKTEGIDLLHPRYYDISSIQTGLDNPAGYRFVEFPIVSAIHALASNFSPYDFDTTGRLISVFFSQLSLILVFFIGKKLYNSPIGLISAFFFAVLPFNIYYSRVILPEPAIITFGLAAILAFIIYSQTRSNIYFFISSIFLALTILLKPYAAFYALPILYIAYKTDGLKKIFTQVKYLIFLDIALVPFFLWRAWTWNFIRGIPHWQWAFNGDGIRFRPAFFYWIFQKRIGQLILGTWGVALLAIGTLSNTKNILVTHAFAVGSLLYITLVATANVRHDYYQAIVTPVLCLYLGIGTYQIIKKGKLLPLAIITIFSGFIFLFSWYEIREYYKINHPEIIQAGQAADKILPPDAKVLAPYNGDTAFLYQIKRYGWPVNESTIGETIQKGATHFVAVNFSDPDVKEVESKFTILEKTDKYIIADLTNPKDN